MTKNQKKKGFFITFEGGEGSGKTSQIKRLAKEFDKAGEDVRVTREPGGSLGGEIVRHVLLSGAAESFGPEMETLLFSAARSDNIETIIRPALENGIHVICDRFIDSTRVYQGAPGKVSDVFLNTLERIVCNGVWPDLTIILDIDPEEGLIRATERRKKETSPDRFEREALVLHEERRAAYLSIAQKEPDRCVVVDGSGTQQQVFDNILIAVHDRLGLLGFTEKDSLRGSPSFAPSSKKNIADDCLLISEKGFASDD